MAERPNIVLIMCDDMGYSDIGCFGGEVDTPTLDGLASGGVRFSQFYSSPRCCPSRASLLTGLYPHQAGVGLMTENIGQDGYLGDLSLHSVTIAEVLKEAGYRTYMSGKWHVTRFFDGPKQNWPLQRGFDRFYGLITGAADYYQPRTVTRDNESIEVDRPVYVTDEIADNAVAFVDEHVAQHSDAPFFLYLAFTAPHWPLHAPEEAIAKYKGRFADGWDRLREQRLTRQRNMGLISPKWDMTDRDTSQPAWEDAPHKEWQQRRMEVYAAQIEIMDAGIGRVVDRLRAAGKLDDTLILFLSDNGGCAEEVQPAFGPILLKGKAAAEKTWDGETVVFHNDPNRMPCDEATYQSYGVPWANLSNTPFRLYKHWVHEGGISSPFVAHWPNGIKEPGVIRHAPAQLPDIMATAVDLAGANYPQERQGRPVKALEGFSLRDALNGAAYGRESCFWEHEGNRGVRRGKWKLVRRFPGDWELFDMDVDRTETQDVSAAHPDVVAELSKAYFCWAARSDVRDWPEVRSIVEANRNDMSPP